MAEVRSQRSEVSFVRSDLRPLISDLSFLMVRIEEICDKVRRNHPQADLNLLRRAYLFSAREHRGQKRASGESYLVHPLEVANILADMRLDAVSV
jgi:guanosine-3',5'-bis(diphosphate) 3'-pyrophosphohydrolase